VKNHHHIQHQYYKGRSRFKKPLRGGRSFGSHEEEDKSSGNPQSGKALYDFTAGGDDEVSSEFDGTLVVLKSFLCCGGTKNNLWCFSVVL
jgi:hypothetical protein